MRSDIALETWALLAPCGRSGGIRRTGVHRHEPKTASAKSGVLCDEAHADLIAAAPEPFRAGEAVIDCWSSGDLAGAVRDLAATVEKARYIRPHGATLARKAGGG
jgi:hypothetical protein